MPDTPTEDANTRRGWKVGDTARLSDYGYANERQAAAPKRYVYLLGCTFVAERGGRPQAGHSVNFTATNDAPVSSLAHANELRDRAVDHCATENPALDSDFPGWRGSVVIVGCSLLRVEVERDGEWVLDAWQPWGPVPQPVTQEADRG